jgi:uncharacterized protein YgiM (DUF1202 family)
MSNSIKVLGVAALAVVVSAFSLSGCSAAAGDPDSEELVGADEDVATSGMGVSGSIAVGATLQATTAVNLRSGPSTSKSILHVVPDGGKVTVKAADPNNGFYKVDHNGTVGWTFGKYYKVVDNGSWGSCSVGGVDGSCIDTGACGANHESTPPTLHEPHDPLSTTL